MGLAAQNYNANNMPPYEERLRLTKMVMRLFDHWKLDTKTQLNLLGMKETSRAVLSKYRKGERAVPDDIDKLDRVGLLLLIHQCLRLQFPSNPEIVYSWVNRKNLNFNSARPIDVLYENGIVGLAKVARYLEFEMVR